MNLKKFLQIFSLFAFIAFMLISCWATVDSLHLLLPEWPKPIFWIATIGIFVLASLGSKLIVDSLNQSVRVDNRGWQMIGGIVMLLIFWILFSLPTNTHTFFYRSAVKDVLVHDLTTTKSRLQSLENGGEAKKIIDQEIANFKTKISQLFGNFAAEINNPGELGWADKAESALLKLEAAFGNNVQMQRLKPAGNDHTSRQAIIKAMQVQVDNLVNSTVKSVYEQRLNNINKSLDMKEIRKLINEIQSVQDTLQAMPLNNDQPTEKTGIVLSQAYKIIDNYCDVLINEFGKTYSDQIELVKEDKVAFSGISRTERMRSVIEVWKDFFTGKYAGRGFVFWIIIAALVDIAGFIFFDIAFKKEEY